VERLMPRECISGLVPKRYRRTTIRLPGVRVTDDLLERNFVPASPNRLWCADIKYVRTWQGWLYLAADDGLLPVANGRLVDGSDFEPSSSSTHLRWQSRDVARRPGWSTTRIVRGSRYVSLRFGERCRETSTAQWARKVTTSTLSELLLNRAATETE
jgi:putative transposase